MTASRSWAGLFALACAGLIIVAGCSQDEPTQNPLEAQLGLQPRPEPVRTDPSEFLDQLRLGAFTVCKVVDGDMQFTFLTEASGPGVNNAPIYQPEVTLGNGECADVYESPIGFGTVADTVHITEVLPDGWDVCKVAIWSLEESGGVLDTLYWEYGPGTTEVEGLVDGGKLGCVVVFYNCEVPEEAEGCTPGYWKNHAGSWAATGYGPDDDFDTTFGVDLFDPDLTLCEALNQGGGGDKALGRHAVAALLSMAHPGVDYGLDESEILDAVANGDKGTLADYNEMGCPIGGPSENGKCNGESNNGKGGGPR